MEKRKDTCEHCYYAEQLPNTTLDPRYKCHRYPLEITKCESDWCGDFKPKWEK